MRTSEQTDRIDAAIVAVQREIGAVGKNKEVDASRDSGGGFKFKFATFSAMLSAVRPVMTKHDVALYQGGRFEAGASWQVVTRLSCAGQWVEVSYPIKETGKSGAQGFGGGISFAKRWGLRDLLGIEVADDVEEREGYRDARGDARGPRRAPAPAGLPATLEALRGAQTTGKLAELAHLARGQFPKGEERKAVEKEIDAWMRTAFDDAPDLDAVTALRAETQRVKPTGLDVRDAMIAAEARVKRAVQP